jgi:hypothetical protein
MWKNNLSKWKAALIINCYVEKRLGRWTWSKVWRKENLWKFSVLQKVHNNWFFHMLMLRLVLLSLCFVCIYVYIYVYMCIYASFRCYLRFGVSEEHFMNRFMSVCRVFQPRWSGPKNYMFCHVSRLGSVIRTGIHRVSTCVLCKCLLLNAPSPPKQIWPKSQQL